MDQRIAPANTGKFIDPQRTADGSARAHVALARLDTLWFNTGTLCNITCAGCYIESSPTNDRLAYLSLAEMQSYLAELQDGAWETREIGFTGGEPFMNPAFPAMMEAALVAGYEVLVLTNAMQPMLRPKVMAATAALIRAYPGKLTFRVSLDHWTEAGHDDIRGPGSFEKTLEGMRWLRDQGAALAVAGRATWQDSDMDARAAYADLFSREALPVDANNPATCVIFPDMDLTVEVPEITTACWGILGKSPDSVMCASSRMVVKEKGKSPTVIACTLLPYEPDFDLGATLKDAAGEVSLNHPHCAKFCVLGGASCSA